VRRRKDRLTIPSLSQAVERERELGATMRTYDAQYAELQDIIRSLPKRETHAVMVPCTKFAMFEGELAGGDDVLVGVGAEYLVERSAEGACAIIERRRDLLRSKMRDAEHNALALESRLRAADALELSVGGASSLETILENETLEEDGRARIDRRADGSVEITEIYEAHDEEIASISTLAPSAENERVNADEAQGDLADFIARLEAMELSESGIPTSSRSFVEEEELGDIEDDEGSDVDLEEDGGEPPTIECPEDFPRYERWKAKREAKDKELQAAVEEARARAEQERLLMEAEIRRKHPPLKDAVIERKPGEGRASSSENVDVNRKLSRYQMKKLGLIE